MNYTPDYKCSVWVPDLDCGVGLTLEVESDSDSCDHDIVIGRRTQHLT